MVGLLSGNGDGLKRLQPHKKKKEESGVLQQNTMLDLKLYDEWRMNQAS